MGQQDYELFYMLNEKLLASNTNITAVEVIDALGKDMYFGATVDLQNGTPETLENARLLILKILDKFQSGDENGAIRLIEDEVM